MHRLRVFGTPDLRAAGGAEILSVLAQPKRLALLIHVALRQPLGYHARASLLPMFWPELDDSAARNNLRSALHHLRSSLGPDTLTSRGTEELAVNADVIWCDAVQFERALGDGRLADALELYRAPLLEGFRTDSVEFERWLVQRREQMHALALDAAATLRGEAAAAGRLKDAIHWAVRGVELDPYDSDAIVALVSVLTQAGQHGRARSAYTSWHARFETELETEPDSEIQDAVESLLKQRGAALSSRVQYAGAEPQAIFAKARQFPGSRLKIWAGSALALVVIVTALAPLTRPNRDVEPIAVERFEYIGAHGLRFLEIGAPAVITARLQNLRREVRHPWKLFTDPGRGIRWPFGENGTRVRGSVREEHGEITISAVWSLPGRDRKTRVNGPADSLFALADELVAQLLRENATPNGPNPIQTPSLAALEAYLEGERLYAAGNFAAAVEAYERATARDTGYARAYLRIIHVNNWIGGAGVSPTGLHRAFQHSRRLAAEDRMLLDGWNAFLNGDAMQADRAYSELARSNPHDIDAFIGLGEVRFHWGPQLGNPREEAADAFRKALAIVPGHLNPLMHLTRIEARDGTIMTVDSLRARVLALQPNAKERLEVELIAAIRSGDQTRLGRVLRELTVADAYQRSELMRIVAYTTRDAELAASVVARLVQPGDPLNTRIQAHLYTAQLLAARGRLRAAHLELNRLRALAPYRAAEFHAVLAILPWVNSTPAYYRSLAQAIAHAPVHGPGTIGWRINEAHLDRLVDYRKVYLSHALALLAGERSDIANEVANRRLIPWSGGAGTAGRALGALRAYLDGDPSRGVYALGEAEAEAEGGFPDIMTYGKAFERFMRGELFMAVGRDDHALRWFGTFPDPGGYDLLYLAPSHLRRAQIYEKRGERAVAALHYRRVIELWEDADPALQSYVALAKKGLQRL
ncbi:MAG: BTAD domain-containing putative transcriptional regulator [Gemmatimonadota bacterium]